MAAFSDLNLINGVKSSVDNEIVILKSKTLTENVVEQLGFNISYYMDGRVLTVESYKTSPITVEFLEGADHIASKSVTGLSTTMPNLHPEALRIATEIDALLAPKLSSRPGPTREEIEAGLLRGDEPCDCGETTVEECDDCCDPRED